MSDYEYDMYEGEQSSVEEETSEDADDAEYVSEYAGIHRALFLLIVVLLVGIVLLGLFIAMRPAPVIVPTLKPPWLV